TKTGVVERVEVLSTTNPGYGFEEAAVEAVKQWRYTPARHDGEPVDVYFTIVADFTPSTGKPVLAGTDGVTSPTRIRESYVKPEYAQELREAGVEGKVILQAVITKDGRVGDVKVLRSTNPGHGLEEAAIEAVKQWRYEPATKDGEPVEVLFTVRIDFTLG
ncbi:MAG: energy transducer TonB, partial [Acidobacteriota bacterium]|nr:energy transducer TonB [Acidobacteriota bacterium]